jgi:hypothetical protein
VDSWPSDGPTCTIGYCPQRRVCLAVVLLVACESGAAPVEPQPFGYRPASIAKPNPRFLPFAFSVDNCVETVDVAGTFHEVTEVFVGPNGKELFRFHVNAKGTGVGRTTGARYQWNDRLFDLSNAVPSGRLTFTLNDRTRRIGQGAAVNTVVATQIKVTVNGQGNVTVDRFRALAVCR